jgi:DNA-binding SARP family transcriptional activator
MCLLLEAKIRYNNKEDVEAIALLRDAMRIGRECNIINFSGWHAPTMLQLCIKALEADIEVDYVCNLIRNRNLIPDSPPLDLNNWPWAVKIFTLGRFELLLDGQPATFSRKTSYKQMELLKVLVTHGGTEVNEEKVRDLLWPDIEGDQTQNLFKVTVHRLRKLLGSDKAIRVKDGRIALDKRYVWVDSWLFEHHITQAESLLNAAEDENTTARLKKATELYKGHFLESEPDIPWQFFMRDRLYQKYVSSILTWVDLLEKTGQFKPAIAICNKGLERAPLAEQLYKRLISCYLTSGDRAEAMSSFKRCMNAFVNSGLQPPTAIQADFQKMFNQN